MHRPTVLAVPCFHGHGLATLATALAFAAPVHLARRYEIAPLLARSVFAMPPVVVSVPTLLGRWLMAGSAKDGVAAVLTGSAPLEPQLCRRLLDALGPVVYNLYGSSEAGVVSLAMPTMLVEAPGTVGRPLPGTEVRLLDAGGGATAAGQLGRIHVRGPLVWRHDAEGWLDTGDLGRFDQAGRLYICGRADGMFISGGENVYPQEVEACLRQHPAVAEAAIAVVRDVEFGARMRAFVVVHPGLPVTPEELRAWLRQRLDRHKQPKSIERVEDLPRNALGKIDRAALQQLGSATDYSGQESDVAPR
jgi:acyl-CoA synthetase (AMP-forming)/AMP-acid ligase II